MQRYFKLRPSRAFALLLFLLAALTFASLWLLPLPIAVKITLAAFTFFGAFFSLSRDAGLRSKRSCVAFRLEDHGEIVLVLRNGTHLSGRVAADSLVSPYLVILNVVLSERRGQRSLRILPDAMGADSFRRLRVALRWGDRSDQLAL